jgi:hypothetical protein
LLTEAAWVGQAFNNAGRMLDGFERRWRGLEPGRLREDVLSGVAREAAAWKEHAPALWAEIDGEVARRERERRRREEAERRRQGESSEDWWRDIEAALSRLAEPGRKKFRTALAVLELDETAVPEEIKARFRELAKQHHPDRGGDAATFRKIQEACETAMKGATAPTRP